MIPSDKCYALIKHYESCVLKAYKDSAGIWTIGWGTTQYENAAPIKEGDIIPQFRADDLLKFEIDSKGRSVNIMVSKITIQQSMFDALVSFAYNLGAGALRNSTLLKKVLINPADPFIKDEFMKWNKAMDPKTNQLVILNGLTARRKSESCLYFTDELKYFKG